jgi:hypothetical protein
MTDEERDPQEPGETSDAEGAKRDDAQDPPEGAGEKGLGSATGATEGGGAGVTRGQPTKGEGAARAGGPPNPPEDEPAERENRS